MDLEKAIEIINQGRVVGIDELANNIYRVNFEYQERSFHFVRRVDQKFWMGERDQIETFEFLRNVLNLQVPKIVLMGNDPRLDDRKDDSVSERYGHSLSKYPLGQSNWCGIWMSDITEGGLYTLIQDPLEFGKLTNYIELQVELMESLAGLHHYRFNEQHLDAFIWRCEGEKGVQFILDVDAMYKDMDPPELLPVNLERKEVNPSWASYQYKPHYVAAAKYSFSDEEALRMVEVYNQMRRDLAQSSPTSK